MCGASRAQVSAVIWRSSCVGKDGMWGWALSCESIQEDKEDSSDYSVGSVRDSGMSALIQAQHLVLGVIQGTLEEATGRRRPRRSRLGRKAV